MQEIQFKPIIGESYSYIITEKREFNQEIDTLNILTGNIYKASVSLKATHATNSGFLFDAVLDSYSNELIKVKTNIETYPHIDDSPMDSSESDPIFPQLDGKSFKLTTTRAGHVNDLEGYESVWNKIKNKPNPGSKLVENSSDVGHIAYSKSFFIDLFNNCLQWLPEESVKEGSTWEHHLRFDVSSGRHVDMKIIYRLEHIIDGEAVINADSKFKQNLFPNRESDFAIKSTVKLNQNLGTLTSAKISILVSGFNKYDALVAPYTFTVEKTIKLIKAF